jgi:hypothetical protein
MIARLPHARAVLSGSSKTPRPHEIRRCSKMPALSSEHVCKRVLGACAVVREKHPSRNWDENAAHEQTFWCALAAALSGVASIDKRV